MNCESSMKLLWLTIPWPGLPMNIAKVPKTVVVFRLLMIKMLSPSPCYGLIIPFFMFHPNTKVRRNNQTKHF